MMPVYSAPTEKPARQRRAMTVTAPHTPQVSWPGTRAMPAIATAIRLAEITREDLRPIRSPRCPKTIAPMGRKRKPTEPMARVISREPSYGPKKTRDRLVET